jgi:hypothetical protein
VPPPGATPPNGCEILHRYPPCLPVYRGTSPWPSVCGDPDRLRRRFLLLGDRLHELGVRLLRPPPGTDPQDAEGTLEPAVRLRPDSHPVRLRDGLAFSCVVFLGARLLVSLVAVVGVRAKQPPSVAQQDVSVPATPGWHNAIDGTNRWDAGWLGRIARDGYDWNDQSAAFFPGYPLAIRALAATTPLDEVAGLLVSNAAFLTALVVLYALTTREFSTSTARRTVVLVAAFPTSFFFLAPYSESLFVLASLLTFWWARRGRWGALRQPGSLLLQRGAWE